MNGSIHVKGKDNTSKATHPEHNLNDLTERIISARKSMKLFHYDLYVVANGLLYA